MVPIVRQVSSRYCFDSERIVETRLVVIADIAKPLSEGCSSSAVIRMVAQILPFLQSVTIFSTINSHI